MNNEIKEILDDLRDEYCYLNNETILTFDEASLLLDYITNLQEENKELGRYYTRANNEFLDFYQRVNEAIKYLKGNEHTCNYVDIYNYALREEDLLNILEGGKNNV